MAGLVSPFPSGRVVPAGWADRHAGVSAAAMTATCTVTRAAGTPAWDPVTGPGDTATEVVHTGRCRITVTNTPGTVRDAAGQAILDRTYTVALQSTATGLAVGDVITVDLAPGNPDLIGRALRIRHLTDTSDVFEVLAVCTLDPANQP